ncbi:hypothetical protein ACKWTF_014950 [Chironomus riparius]
MMKYLLYISCLLTYCDPTSLRNIECNYEFKQYTSIGFIFNCQVNTDPQITSRSSSALTLIHSRGAEVNDRVIGFYIYEKTVNYFPKALEKLFKNLKAISIESCKLKEVTQLDLKPFPKLAYLQLSLNLIEVIEPGLFDFNRDLQVISFESNNILHVDSNVFDKLPKLTYLWFHGVPCYDNILSAKRSPQEIVKKLKSVCIDPEFLALSGKFEDFEGEIKSLNFDNFEVRFSSFTNEVKGLKFFGTSYFNDRLDALKHSYKASTLSTSEGPLEIHSKAKIEPTSSTVLRGSKSCENCCKIDETLDLSFKFGNLSLAINYLKSSQVEVVDSLNEIKMTVNTQDTKLKDLQESQNILKTSVDTQNSINDLKSSQNALQSLQNDTKITLDALKTSQISLKSLQNQLKASQNEVLSSLEDTKTSISDIETSVNSIKASQNEAKSSLNKLRTSQNGIENSLIKMSENEDFKESLKKIDEKLESLDVKFGEKLKENNEKLEEIKLELASTRQKMSINFDEKIKGIEKRLSKKFEDILEEQLGKVLDEKFAMLLNA